MVVGIKLLVRISGHATHLHIKKRMLSNPHPYYLFERVTVALSCHVDALFFSDERRR